MASGGFIQGSGVPLATTCALKAGFHKAIMPQIPSGRLLLLSGRNFHCPIMASPTPQPGGFMISRRRFLEVGGVAAGVAAVSRHLPASGAPSDKKPHNASLPPSLARLKSRKSEAVPISREE